jgi:hypothetical protein
MDSLPLEILKEILSNMTLSNMIRVARVAVCWKYVVYEITGRKLWKDIYCHMKGKTLILTSQSLTFSTNIEFPLTFSEPCKPFPLSRMIEYLDNKEWLSTPIYQSCGIYSPEISIILSKTFKIICPRTGIVLYDIGPDFIYWIFRLVHSLNRITYCAKI